MKLSWHNPSMFEGNMWVDILGERELIATGIDARPGDIFIMDHDTGIVYQGHMSEGTSYLEKEVTAFLAST